MTSALRCRNARHIIPNPNLAFIRHFSDKTQDAKPVPVHVVQCNDKAETEVMDFPDEPTTCCMSGCANCVWLDYAEKISAYYKDGGERAVKEINERVSDANIKAFLMHELRMRQKT